MLEFKLNYYFEKYKNYPLSSSTKFKVEFVKNNGEFQLLNELIVMIQRYQIEKYGEVLEHGSITLKRPNKYTYCNRENNRKIRRFGTREERIRRSLNDRK